MSRRAKGPRLHVREARKTKSGGLNNHPLFVILDRINGKPYEESTGCGVDNRVGAEKALAEYIALKHVKGITSKGASKQPQDIPVADVLSLYQIKKVAEQARPDEVTARINKLLVFWGDKTLADVNGALCDTYAETRTTMNAARRELEDLRAAINFHRRQGLCHAVIEIALPGQKAQPRERWLTHDEAAKMLWEAWRYKEKQKFHASDRFTRRHIAKFILVGCYTGTRSGAICNASFEKMPGRGYIDLEKGVYYRRAAGERETKKRKPPIQLPPQLLAHLRKWRKNGQRFVIEWNGKPVKRMYRAFRAVASAAGLGRDVIPHILRHTAATWAMQNGADPWQAAGYLGMTVEMLIRNYGHHHPEQYTDVHEALERRKARAKNVA